MIRSLILAAFMTCCNFLHAQVSLFEDFENSTFPPSGWNTDGFSRNFGGSCNSTWSATCNVWVFDSYDDLTSPTVISNGQDLTISLDYRLVGNDNGNIQGFTLTRYLLVDRPVAPDTLISLDVINQSSFCQTTTSVVAGQYLPNGSSVRLRIACNSPSNSVDTYLDNISMTQLPSCVTPTPMDGASNLNGHPMLSWTPSAIATAYNVYFGTTPNPPLVSTQAGTSYDPGVLLSNATYYWKVNPANTNGLSSCPVWRFTTAECPLSTGTYLVSLPLSVTGQSTCGKSNDLTSTNVSQVCTSYGDFYSGEDEMYVFTPTTTAGYDIDLTTATAVNAAFMLYNGCPLSGGTCITNDQGVSGLTRSARSVPLIAGNTYYLVIDNWGPPSCISSYDLSVRIAPPICVTLETPATGTTNLDPNNITLTWTPASMGSSPSLYTVGLDNGISPATYVTISSSATSYQVSGLLPNTIYNWTIIPFGEGGASVNCPVSFFGTRASNDACTDAASFPAIPTDGTCATVIANTYGTTGTNTPACLGTADDDMWYTFTVPVGYTSIQYTTADLTYALMNRPIENDRVFELYNSCGGMSVGCYDNESGLFPGLTPGTTYWLRIYTRGSGVVSKFELCLKLPAPSNDDCAGATAFPALSADGSCATVNANTAGATASALPNCIGTADDDIWYTFDVPAGSPTVQYSVTHISGTNDRIFELYTACGGTSLHCKDDEAGLFSGLNAGTYFLRVYTPAAGVSSKFDICLKLRAFNDECASPMAFPTISTGSSCATVTVNTANASGTNEAACTGTADDDLWYAFTVPAGFNTIDYVTANATGASSYVLQVYDICGGTSLSCNQGSSGSFQNLTPGASYLLRVYTADANVAAKFDLCLKVPNAAFPGNDEPANAISITNAQGGIVNVSIQALPAATQTFPASICCAYNQYAAYPSCCTQFPGLECFDNVTPAFDVWYKFQTVTNGNITISINSNAYLGLEVVADAGQTFGNSACDANASPSVTLSNLPAGIYYFRVYSFSQSPLLFTISASGSALPVELKAFTGQVKEHENVLEWETQTEKNVAWHVVERSADGLNWLGIGQIVGKGDSEVVNRYSLTDRLPLTRAYYRLRSVDADGQSSLSKTIILTRPEKTWGISMVYPSPTSDQVTVQFNTTQEEPVSLRITDLSGRLLLQQAVEASNGSNSLTLTVSNLPAGLYLVSLHHGTTASEAMRFIKQ